MSNELPVNSGNSDAQLRLEPSESVSGNQTLAETLTIDGPPAHHDGDDAKASQRPLRELGAIGDVVERRGRSVERQPEEVGQPRQREPAQADLARQGQDGDDCEFPSIGSAELGH
jgi:hypothetical protein